MVKKGVEVPPKPKDQTATKLKEMLKVVMAKYVAESDRSRVIHVDRVRIPSHSSGFSDLRFKGNDTELSNADAPKSIHASKVYNYVYRSSERRQFDIPNQNDMIVEVKVLNSGKWHRALVLGVSESNVSQGSTLSNDQNTETGLNNKKRVHKRRGSVSAKTSTPKYPCYYTVQLMKGSRNARLDEEIDLVLQKCAEQVFMYLCAYVGEHNLVLNLPFSYHVFPSSYHIKKRARNQPRLKMKAQAKLVSYVRK
jgi:hypothetical protein